MKTRWLASWLLLLLIALLGCRSQATEQPALKVSLTVAPDPPVVGTATVTVTLRDATDQPVTGATVDLEGTMTHAGMKSSLATATEQAGEAGVYTAPLEFTMGGDWIIIVRAKLADGRTVEQNFNVSGVKNP